MRDAEERRDCERDDRALERKRASRERDAWLEESERDPHASATRLVRVFIEGRKGSAATRLN